MRVPVAVGLALLFGLPCAALADEQVSTLAESGDWLAIAHSMSMTDPPDVCVAVNTSQTLAVRGDGSSIEVRSANTKWSLPDGVTGTIAILVNGDTYSFDIVENTATLVGATVDPDKVGLLLDDIAKAENLQLTIGKAAPITVSLAGSTTVLNAFRTCDGLSGSAPGGGSNPFE